ncbi:MAG: radical SAM protein [Armatimonadota bacterium]|nr:radical SAM protein [Armatimonadota bacterium]
MKVLLVHPPTRAEIDVYRTESVGLGYIASALREDGHEVEIFDASVTRLSCRRAIDQVLERDFDCLGITAMHEQWRFVVQLAKAVRSERKKVLITVGGYLPTLAPQPLLRTCPELDFVVRGEGENVIREVLSRIERNQDWTNVAGVAYLSDGKVFMNELPRAHRDLDSLPFPARDVLIRHPWLKRAPFSSSRGCFHRCAFCSINEFYALCGQRGRRDRSPANVVDEMEQVLSATGIDYFVFSDDDFIGPGEKCKMRAYAIADEILSRKLRIRFSFECRADEVDRDLFKRLMEAGLDAVFIGIESGSPTQLERFRKGTTVEQNRAAVETIRELGLKMDVGFIMFDPYVTLEELEENMSFVRDLRLSVPMIRLQLYPGLPVIDRIREDGLLIEKGLDLDYRFKNPGVAQAYKAMRLSMAARAAVWKLRDRLGLAAGR